VTLLVAVAGGTLALLGGRPEHFALAMLISAMALRSARALPLVALLLVLGRKLADKLKAGDLFLIYLITYSFGRFLLEFIRIDYSPIAGLNINQTLMVVVFVLSVSGLSGSSQEVPSVHRCFCRNLFLSGTE